MLFVIEFRDASERRHLRQELMAAHLDFLRSKEAVVRVAGSLRKEEDDSAVGGIWIVEAQNFNAVRQLYSEDPFWIAGLRASVEVHRLAKAFPDREKMI
jgi:uncharacterized protein YciI